MSIFDVLTNGSMGSVIDSISKQIGGGGMGSVLDSIGKQIGGGNLGSVLDSLGEKARSTATNIRDNTPGGLGGLAGAGALGALLGNVFSGDLMKSVALAGAGAVAWNFYKKWASQQKQGSESGDLPPGWGPSQESAAPPAGWAGSTAPAPGVDPVAELVMRAMIYAARADGNIDATERERINAVLQNMFPGKNVEAVVERIEKEPIDPNKIAEAVSSPEQAEDVYRLSCAIIDIDHFMEHSYTDALAKSLGLDAAKKKQLETEADQARRQLMASIPH